MAILTFDENRVLIHGGTGQYGAAQVGWMRAAGTQVVGFISPGRGGQVIEGLPVFDLVGEAVASTDANCSMLYVPAMGVKDAVVENAEAGIRLCVAAAELVPVHDTLKAVAQARARGMWLVGPNTLGLATPGRFTLGSYPADFCAPGRVGLMSRSGTMAVMATRLLTLSNCGQSSVVHMGGDTVIGRNPKEYLDLFLNDTETDVIVYLGEIGGGKEYEMLEALRDGGKPVVAMIVGRNAPAGSKMGHAGALIGDSRESAAAKREALMEAGAHVVDSLMEMVRTVSQLLAARASRRTMTATLQVNL